MNIKISLHCLVGVQLLQFICCIAFNSVLKFSCNRCQGKASVIYCVGTLIHPTIFITSSFCATCCQYVKSGRNNYNITHKYIYNGAFDKDIALVQVPSYPKTSKTVRISGYDSATVLGFVASFPVFLTKTVLRKQVVQKCDIGKWYKHKRYLCVLNQLTVGLKCLHEEGIPLLINDRIIAISIQPSSNICKMTQKPFVAVTAAISWIQRILSGIKGSNILKSSSTFIPNSIKIPPKILVSGFTMKNDNKFNAVPNTADNLRQRVQRNDNNQNDSDIHNKIDREEKSYENITEQNNHKQNLTDIYIHHNDKVNLVTQNYSKVIKNVSLKYSNIQHNIDDMSKNSHYRANTEQSPIDIGTSTVSTPNLIHVLSNLNMSSPFMTVKPNTESANKSIKLGSRFTSIDLPHTRGTTSSLIKNTKISIEIETPTSYVLFPNLPLKLRSQIITELILKNLNSSKITTSKDILDIISSYETKPKISSLPNFSTSSVTMSNLSTTFSNVRTNSQMQHHSRGLSKKPLETLVKSKPNSDNRIHILDKLPASSNIKLNIISSETIPNIEHETLITVKQLKLSPKVTQSNVSYLTPAIKKQKFSTRITRKQLQYFKPSTFISAKPKKLKRILKPNTPIMVYRVHNTTRKRLKAYTRKALKPLSVFSSKTTTAKIDSPEIPSTKSFIKVYDTSSDTSVEIVKLRQQRHRTTKRRKKQHEKVKVDYKSTDAMEWFNNMRKKFTKSGQYLILTTPEVWSETKKFKDLTR